MKDCAKSFTHFLCSLGSFIAVWQRWVEALQIDRDPAFKIVNSFMSFWVTGFIDALALMFYFSFEQAGTEVVSVITTMLAYGRIFF